jgi:DNA anti-recombination protein RmuC
MHDLFSTVAERLTMAQAELAARMQQTQAAIDQRLDGLVRRLGESLVQQTERAGERLQVLHQRSALIDAAQKTIAELSRRCHSQPRWRK